MDFRFPGLEAFIYPVLAKLIDRFDRSFGVGCQEHVRGIEPIHLAARLRSYDLAHLPPVHQIVKTPMQTQDGACDLA